MEKKKTIFAKLAADAGKNATAILEKTKDTVIKAVDQNDDGTLNIKDVSAIAGTISTAAKKAASAIKDSAETRSHEQEKAQLQPIFIEDINSADFLMPKLIRITEIDKKRAESEVCQGSIGYYTNQKELKIVNIFRNCADAFGVSFYPNKDSEMYYIDPSDRDRYIALDDYFNYLKIVRVNELQRIAQDLGAKHFRVLYREQTSNSSDSSAKGKMIFKAAGNNVFADGEKSVHSKESASVEIAAENIFPGHDPVTPELHYLQQEPAVLNLIRMRMNEQSPTQHESFSLSLINSSGIKEKDAIKIDAALRAMKITGNSDITVEAKNEARRFFQFEVDF